VVQRRTADGDEFGVQRRGNEAPFRRRIGVRQAAAERAAHADRIMRDMLHYNGEHRAEPTVLDPAMKRGMPDPRADAQPAAFRDKPVEPGNGIDVDQMRRARQTVRHHRH